MIGCWQFPVDLCKEALEISFTLKDITCEVEDGLNEAANDLCAPEDIPMNRRAARPDSSSVTGSESATGQAPAKASSAAGSFKLAEALSQGSQQSKKKGSGGPCFSHADIWDCGWRHICAWPSWYTKGWTAAFQKFQLACRRS